MELATMDLSDLVGLKGSLPEDELYWLMVQVVDGLEYLHKHKVAHRDIKPQNILIFGEDRNVAKLTDYSLVREVGSHTISRSWLGTRMYMAPELHLHSKIKDVFKLDVWALGITIYECLMGQRLDWDPRAAADAARESSNMSPMIEEYDKMIDQVEACGKSREVVNLMGWMLDIEVEDRYSLKQVKKHPWMTGGDLSDSSFEDDRFEPGFIHPSGGAAGSSSAGGAGRTPGGAGRTPGGAVGGAGRTPRGAVGGMSSD